MPLINVDVIENVFTPAQKQEIVEKLTNAMVEIEGAALREVTSGENQRNQGKQLGHRRSTPTGRGRAPDATLGELTGMNTVMARLSIAQALGALARTPAQPA